MVKTSSHATYHQDPSPLLFWMLLKNKVILRNRICIPGSGPGRIYKDEVTHSWKWCFILETVIPSKPNKMDSIPGDEDSVYEIIQKLCIFYFNREYTSGHFWWSQQQLWQRLSFCACVYCSQRVTGLVNQSSVPLLNHLATWTMYRRSQCGLCEPITDKPSADCQPHEQNQTLFIQDLRPDWWLYLQCWFICLVLNYIAVVRNIRNPTKVWACFATTKQVLNGIIIKLPCI